ncbi:hypothetical protein NLM16_05950 [Bradyrhizobium brasilense]|uniref:hypothetical protein n=1 Tax=Bradyrhizobium brasilense TaxID=1419277 RepID=UPI0028780D6D|nr:hypothetical protein [Bradyrhizobium brasilense]MCP3413637.1 hypothetical protein [Bradyrhizobium brasilense]
MRPKSKLDAAVYGRTELWQVSNSLAGWRILMTKLAEAGVSRISIEATGGYERGAVEHLRAAGFAVLVLQPIQDSRPRMTSSAARPGSSTSISPPYDARCLATLPG